MDDKHKKLRRLKQEPARLSDVPLPVAPASPELGLKLPALKVSDWKVLVSDRKVQISEDHLPDLVPKPPRCPNSKRRSRAARKAARKAAGAETVQELLAPCQVNKFSLTELYRAVEAAAAAYRSSLAADLAEVSTMLTGGSCAKMPPVNHSSYCVLPPIKSSTPPVEPIRAWGSESPIPLGCRSTADGRVSMFSSAAPLSLLSPPLSPSHLEVQSPASPPPTLDDPVTRETTPSVLSLEKAEEERSVLKALMSHPHWKIINRVLLRKNKSVAELQERSEEVMEWVLKVTNQVVLPAMALYQVLHTHQDQDGHLLSAASVECSSAGPKELEEKNHQRKETAPLLSRSPSAQSEASSAASCQDLSLTAENMLDTILRTAHAASTSSRGNGYDNKPESFVKSFDQPEFDLGRLLASRSMCTRMFQGSIHCFSEELIGRFYQLLLDTRMGRLPSAPHCCSELNFQHLEDKERLDQELFTPLLCEFLQTAFKSLMGNLLGEEDCTDDLRVESCSGASSDSSDSSDCLSLDWSRGMTPGPRQGGRRRSQSRLKPSCSQDQRRALEAICEVLTSQAGNDLYKTRNDPKENTVVVSEGLDAEAMSRVDNPASLSGDINQKVTTESVDSESGLTIQEEDRPQMDDNRNDDNPDDFHNEEEGSYCQMSDVSKSALIEEKDEDDTAAGLSEEVQDHPSSPVSPPGTSSIQPWGVLIQVVESTGLEKFSGRASPFTRHTSLNEVEVESTGLEKASGRASPFTRNTSLTEGVEMESAGLEKASGNSNTITNSSMDERVEVESAGLEKASEIHSCSSPSPSSSSSFTSRGLIAQAPVLEGDHPGTLTTVDIPIRQRRFRLKKEKTFLTDGLYVAAMGKNTHGLFRMNKMSPCSYESPDLGESSIPRREEKKNKKKSIKAFFQGISAAFSKAFCCCCMDDVYQ